VKKSYILLWLVCILQWPFFIFMILADNAGFTCNSNYLCEIWVALWVYFVTIAQLQPLLIVLMVLFISRLFMKKKIGKLEMLLVFLAWLSWGATLYLQVTGAVQTERHFSYLSTSVVALSSYPRIAL
jgi:hypothetical protein